MKKYKFILKKTETPVVIYDNSAADKKFKEKLKGWLIDILDSESLVEHLKEIVVYFEDRPLDEYDVKKTIETDERQRVYAGYEKDKGMYFFTNWCQALYQVKGETFFLNGLSTTITHELVHYVFWEINEYSVKMEAVNDLLIKRYTEQYPLFQKGMFVELLSIMNAFVMQCMNEGFALFIDQMKHNQLVFTKAKFDELYNDAKIAAKNVVGVFEQASKLDNLSAVEELVFNNIFKVQAYPYAIGLHMIYSLFYFHETNLEKDINYMIGLFVDSMGRMTPKKIVQEYTKVMRAHRKYPVISYEPTPYINLVALKETWQVLLKRFMAKQLLQP